MPSSGDLPNPEFKSRFPTFQVDSLLAEPPGKPKNTGVGSLSLLKRIFLTQESNRGLLHCRQILCQPSYQGSPQQIIVLVLTLNYLSSCQSLINTSAVVLCTSKYCLHVCSFLLLHLDCKQQQDGNAVQEISHKFKSYPCYFTYVLGQDTDWTCISLSVKTQR